MRRQRRLRPSDIDAMHHAMSGALRTAVGTGYRPPPPPPWWQRLLSGAAGAFMYVLAFALVLLLVGLLTAAVRYGWEAASRPSSDDVSACRAAMAEHDEGTALERARDRLDGRPAECDGINP